MKRTSRKRGNPSLDIIGYRLAAGAAPVVVPIPGTTKHHRLQENIVASTVELTAAPRRPCGWP